jgi:hypothetical protein
MKKDIPKYVTQARAAYLLGIPMEEIARLSQEGGIGHVERAGNVEERFFTYEELQRICVMATYEGAATH